MEFYTKGEGGWSMMPDFPIIKRGKKPGLKTIDSALDHFFSLMGGRAGAVENCTTFFSNPSPNKLNNHRRILKKNLPNFETAPQDAKDTKKVWMVWRVLWLQNFHSSRVYNSR